MLKPNPDGTAKFLLVVIAMPLTKAEEKLSELLEEQLRPINEAIEDLITNEAIAKHIDLLETKLVKKINEQAAEIDQRKTRHNHLEGRVAILENLVKLQEIKSDDVKQCRRRLWRTETGEIVLSKSFKFKVDLTKRRVNLLDKARKTTINSTCCGDKIRISLYQLPVECQIYG